MQKIVFIFISLCFNAVLAQKRTISGTVFDLETGEKMQGVLVLDTISKKSTKTNEYGFYSLSTPDIKTCLRYFYPGFIRKYVSIETGNQMLDISISNKTEIEEVVINAKKTNDIIENSTTGTIELSLEKVEKLPVFLGERDVLKTLQLMPGIKSGGEGSSGIYVRGGGPDQNLFLIDGVPVYNASHLFGFFSVFNHDALANVTAIKGGFPARYGGRISSVIDMRLKEGSQKSFKIKGSIGLIASKLLIEGPLKKDKGSFIISARRTYLDALVKLAVPKIKAGYYFYDLNAKLNYKLNDKHRIYLSGYFGDDRAYFSDKSDQGNGTTSKLKSGLNWGNAIIAFRWNYLIAPKLFANTTLTYSKYKFNVFSSEERKYGNDVQKDEFRYLSGIDDLGSKIDLNWYPDANNKVRLGFGYIYHTFSPGITRVSESNNSFDPTTSLNIGSSKQYANDFSLYIEDDISIGNRVDINIGIHFNAFLVNKSTYNLLQPRISGNIKLTEKNSIKFAYASTAQALHLLTNQGLGLPTDLWVPATDRIAPQTANQFGLSFFQLLPKDFVFSIEGYYKKMNNLIQYSEGAGFLSGGLDWQDKVQVGKGWSYGIEFLLEKKLGKFSGWIGYTLSWANRQFENINFGRVFPYKYDRRHDGSLVLTYDINKTWDLGIVFVYGTGNAITLESQKYGAITNPIVNSFNSSNTVNYVKSINNYRMPAYHRMDIGFNRKRKKMYGFSTLSLSIYNVYSRQNPYFLQVGQNDKTNETELQQVSLFPIIPAISWSFDFDFSTYKQSRLNKVKK